MSRPLFLVSTEMLVRIRPGDTIQVEGSEGRHAVSVRRMGSGEHVDLGDGAGRRAQGVVSGTLGRDRMTVLIEHVETIQPPHPRITVIQALAKGDRATQAVELLTEVGVDAIVPWSAARSIARWDGQKAATGQTRWQSVAREAGKQARRVWHPVVEPLAGTNDVLARVSSADLSLILHEEADRGLASVHWEDARDIVLVVGPEGGLDDAEMKALSEAGGIAVLAGPTVMRTSTAGAVAAGVVLSRTPRWA